LKAAATFSVSLFTLVPTVPTRAAAGEQALKQARPSSQFRRPTAQRLINRRVQPQPQPQPRGLTSAPRHDSVHTRRAPGRGRGRPRRRRALPAIPRGSHAAARSHSIATASVIQSNPQPPVGGGPARYKSPGRLTPRLGPQPQLRRFRSRLRLHATPPRRRFSLAPAWPPRRPPPPSTTSPSRSAPFVSPPSPLSPKTLLREGSRGDRSLQFFTRVACLACLGPLAALSPGVPVTAESRFVQCEFCCGSV